MKNFKPLSLALLTISLTTPVFAASTVLVPSQQGGFKVGVDALYLRASNSDLNYATMLTFPQGFSEGFEQNHNVDPSYDWGFYAQVGYLFPCTGNDLTVGYTHLRMNETDSVEGQEIIQVVPLIRIGSQLSGFNFNIIPDSVQGKALVNLDTADLEGGQRFTTGGFDLRMFAGMRYSHLDHDLNTAVDGEVSFSGGPLPATASQKFTSDFSGIGPRLGVDGRYCLRSGFGVDAHLSTALLIGNISSHYHAEGNVPDGPSELITTFDFDATNGSHTRIVPNLDAKLGVDYTYPLRGCTKSAIVLEVGYQTNNYFNVVDRPTILDITASSFEYQNMTTDVGFDGLYAGVKYYA